jgi:cell division protein YceG involved in septum cleavage
LKLSDTSKKNFYRTLILASIVEKEERDPTQKPFVA